MSGSRKFCQGGSRPDCLKTALTKFFVILFLVLNLFYSLTVAYQRFISKKTMLFQGFGGGSTFPGGPTFSRGGPTFSRGGGGGPNANYYRNPDKLQFSRGEGQYPLFPPLDSQMNLKTQ